MSSKELLLFVDDEPELVTAFSSLLSANYEVQVFESAKEALQFIQAGRMPAVVVSDLNMPEMDGFGLCRALRETGCITPMILMSGYLDKELSIQAVNNGVYGVIEKPFRIHALQALVETAVQDYSKMLREKKFKDSANEFVSISQGVMKNYKQRYEESERLLKSLGLLPNSPAAQMKEIFGTEDLEAQVGQLLHHLSELNQSDAGLRVVKKVA